MPVAPHPAPGHIVTFTDAPLQLRNAWSVRKISKHFLILAGKSLLWMLQTVFYHTTWASTATSEGFVRTSEDCENAVDGTHYLWIWGYPGQRSVCEPGCAWGPPSPSGPPDTLWVYITMGPRQAWVVPTTWAPYSTIPRAVQASTPACSSGGLPSLTINALGESSLKFENVISGLF